MKFISLSAPPSYYAKWRKSSGINELCINGEPVLRSQVAPVEFYAVQVETRPFEYSPLYQGTDESEAEKILASVKGNAKAEIKKSMGLPDFKFCINRAMGQPICIVNHENDANGCLVEKTILGSHGFKAATDGEVLAKYRTEGKVWETGTWFTVLSVLLPGQNLIVEYSRVKSGIHKSKSSWDGKLLITEDISRQTEATTSVRSPWNTLEKLQLK